MPGTHIPPTAPSSWGVPEEAIVGSLAVRALPIRPADAAELAIIRERHLLDPAILETNPLWTFAAVASSDRLEESYGTRHHLSSLTNYAEDARGGLAFMDSHNTRQQPLGRTFEASLIQDGESARVEELIYVLANRTPNGPGALSTNDLIDNLRGGTTRDVSISFYGGRWLCSICGLDMMRDWDCWHFPMLFYPTVDPETGDEGEPELCVAWVHDAHQSELSGVYAGANDDAMVIKARSMADAGLLKPPVARILTARFRSKLPGTDPLVALGAIVQSDTPKEETDMPNTRTEAAGAEGAATLDEAAIRAAVLAEVQPRIDTLEATVATAREHAAGLEVVIGQLRTVLGLDAEADVVAEVRSLSDDRLRLRPLADDGTAYKAIVITETLEARLRAFGQEGAQEEQYRTVLDSLPVSSIVLMRDEARKLAAELFPGGRGTRDDAEAGKPAAKRNGRVSTASVSNA